MWQCRSVNKEEADKNIQDAHEAIRPTDVSPYAGPCKRISVQRPVPSVSADLETICGKPYDSRLYMRRHL